MELATQILLSTQFKLFATCLVHQEPGCFLKEIEMEYQWHMLKGPVLFSRSYIYRCYEIGQKGGHKIRSKI